MTQHTITYDDATHQVVPKEPALEMLTRAVVRALHTTVSFDYDWPQYMRDLWLEMLAAAPKPETVSRAVPSDADLQQLADKYDESDALEGGASGFDAIGFARALLERYGQPAASAEPVAVVDHVGSSYGSGPGHHTTIVTTDADTSRITNGARLFLQPPFDFAAHLNRQHDFSLRIFGPGARTAGVVDHIRKELREVEESNGDLAEWTDVIILALDGALRSGAAAPEVIAALVAKQTKNEGRKWPDWRTADPGKAIEHDRSQGAAPVAAQTQPVVNQSADEREAFEAHCLARGYARRDLTRLPDGYYVSSITYMWDGWQARAALAQPSKPQQWEGVDDPFFSPENMTGLDKDELIRQLQWALNYWMPTIAGDETPDGERAAHDAYLLYGMKTPVGREDENTPSYWDKQQPSAQDREDAERWRYIVRKVRAIGTAFSGYEFQIINLPRPLGNPMQGSVAQHFEEAIDAARAAKGE